MPIYESDARTRRHRVTVALRKAVLKEGKHQAANRIYRQLCDWAEDQSPEFMESREVPVPNTLKNWIPNEGSDIGPRYVDVMERFLKAKHRECFLTPHDDVRALQEVTRYFGQRKSVTLQYGPILEGEWLMYRPFRSDDNSYLVSEVLITFDHHAGTIIAQDDVAFQTDANDESMIHERWDGVCITSGMFLHMMLRTVHKTDVQVTNNKFILFDRFDEGHDTTPQGHQKIYRALGQTLIGIGRLHRSDIFDTILQRRVGGFEKEKTGQFNFNQLHKDIQAAFKRKIRR